MNPFRIKRLWRRPWLSLCGLILTGVLCFMLCFLTGYLNRQQAQMEETKNSFEILCVVTNRSGTQSTSLRMAPICVAPLTYEDEPLYPHVRDLRVTKEFLVSGSSLALDQNLLIGVSNERCAEPLNPTMDRQVEFWEPDFYSRSDYVCLVSQGQFQHLTPAEDGQYLLKLSVTDPYVNQASQPGVVTLKVVGCYKGADKTLYMPYPASQALAVELSGRATSDSAAFIAADNRRLEELAEAASKDFGQVDPSAGPDSNPRYALTIHDEQYRGTLATLEQNIRRTQILLPLLLLLGLGTGFLVSFLGTRGEMRTYALMRTLGLTKGKLLASIVWEQTILPLAASLAVGIATWNPIPAALYLVCHVIGCFAAVIRAIRVPPTAILREQE